MNRAILTGSVILAITVLATVSIVPYATAGNGGLISFTHFDRNNIFLENGVCNVSIKTIDYFTRGPLIVTLNNGVSAGAEFIAPHGTDHIQINYNSLITEITKINFIKRSSVIGVIDAAALDSATSVDFKAAKIFGATSVCGGDALRGTVSATVSPAD